MFYNRRLCFIDFTINSTLRRGCKTILVLHLIHFFIDFLYTLKLFSNGSMKMQYKIINKIEIIMNYKTVRKNFGKCKGHKMMKNI